MSRIPLNRNVPEINGTPAVNVLKEATDICQALGVVSRKASGDGDLPTAVAAMSTALGYLQFIAAQQKGSGA